jgi:RimJ/RimL family protein N-acetyltransferase
MMRILLETQRLRLRQFTAADVDHLYHLDNDPEVMRYINGGTPTSRDVIQNEILPGFCQYNGRLPGFGVWAAEERVTGEFVGWFSLRLTNESGREAALGYRLKRAAWGKGYATEGAQALLRQSFTAWGLQRVVATTYEENMASRRVMEKVGMRLVRRFRLTPEDILDSDTFYTESVEVWDGDDVEYAIEKSEWEILSLP